MAISQLINTISSKNIVIPNKESASNLAQTNDFTKYSLIHEHSGNTKLRIYYTFREYSMQDSIFINVSHLPILENLSQYYHIKQVMGKEIKFARILYKDNQQGNIYATKDGGLLLEPNQGKAVQISKADLAKEYKDIKLEITDIPQGALITVNQLR